MRSALSLIFDRYTLALLATVLLASLLPCRGAAATGFEALTVGAIALLFFLHGAKLPREAVVAGLLNWRLHLLVLACTFVLFPLLGLLMQPLATRLVGTPLALGLLFLCTLPSTVQSSIAFTSIARGNVPAAVCAASASSLLGIFITPLLVGLLMHNGGDTSGPATLAAIEGIVLQLFVPFVAGQFARRWIARFIHRHQHMVGLVDRGSILLVVYTAFSTAVVAGLWQQVSPHAFAWLLVICCGLLALALAATGTLGRRLGFPRADRITILFCGSKKSLASGIPMAHVLFAGGTVGAIVLPLMLFHQIQLMVCAVLAQRFARQADAAAA